MERFTLLIIALALLIILITLALFPMFAPAREPATATAAPHTYIPATPTPAPDIHTRTPAEIATIAAQSTAGVATLRAGLEE